MASRVDEEGPHGVQAVALAWAAIVPEGHRTQAPPLVRYVLAGHLSTPRSASGTIQLHKKIQNVRLHGDCEPGRQGKCTTARVESEGKGAAVHVCRCRENELGELNGTSR